MTEPNTPIDRGDRERLPADHYVFVAGVNAAGAPAYFLVGPDNRIMVNTTPPTPVARVPSVAPFTSDTTVPAGAKSVTFIFSADFAGTVAGGAFAGATDASFDFVAPPGDTLADIAVTISAGSVRIAKVD